MTAHFLNFRQKKSNIIDDSDNIDTMFQVIQKEKEKQFQFKTAIISTDFLVGQNPEYLWL